MRRLTILMIASGRGIGLSHKLTDYSILLNKKNVDIIILTSLKEQSIGLKDKLAKEKIKYYEIPNIDKLNIIDIIYTIKMIYNIIQLENIDIIHVHGLIHLFYAYSAKTLLIRNKNILVVSHIRRYKQVFCGLTSFLTLRFFNHASSGIIFLSELAKSKALSYGVSNQKSFVIPTGLDIIEFDKNYNSEFPFFNLSANSDKNQFVACIATLNPWKGHDILLKAACEVIKEFPHAYFILAGDGPLRNTLENLSRELGLSQNVIFTGWMDNSNIISMLRIIDIVVLPSTGDMLPVSILEAMAASKPVIASAIGGTPELITSDKNGLLVPSNNPELLGKAIKYLLENDDKAKEMGILNRKMIECHYNIDYMINKWVEVYQKLYDNNNP